MNLLFDLRCDLQFLYTSITIRLRECILVVDSFVGYMYYFGG